MIERLGFRDNWSAAKELHTFAEVSSGRDINLVPFGFRQPEFAQWWLVPGPNPEMPAYPHGKMFIRTVKSGKHAGSAYLGYYVEKGFDPVVGKVVHLEAKHLLGKDWCWHAVVRDIGAGEMDGAVSRIVTPSDVPVVLSIQASEMNVPPDPANDVTYGDTVRFNASDGVLSLATPATNVLRGLNECQTLSVISKALEHDDLRFYWVGIRIGVILPYGHEGTGWSASDVWLNVMSPFLRWFR